MGSGIKVPYRLPSGEQIPLDSTTVSVLKEITAIDPRLFVRWSTDNRYQVWRLGENGREYFVKSWGPNEFDSRVIQHLKANDMRTRGNAIMTEIEKQNEEWLRRKEKEEEEFAREWAERVDFAIRKYSDSYDGGDTPIKSRPKKKNRRTFT